MRAARDCGRPAKGEESSVLPLEVVSVLVAVIWGLVAVFWGVVTYWEWSHRTEARLQEIAAQKSEHGHLSAGELTWRVFARGVVIGLPALFVIDGLWFRIGILYSPALTLDTGFDLALQIVGVVISAVGLAILIVVGWTVSVKIYALATHERQLITTGAHHYVRHPFYLHFALLPAGLFLLTLNYVALVLVVLFSEVWEPKLLTTEIREEEAGLHNLFGADYEEYAERTGRLFPRLRRR
jgi:protein-S-isoprenylcysteine O-methyltransferase Ste14